MKCPKCETINPADSKFCKECATPLPFSDKPQLSVTRTLETKADELARGTVFAGRYEIIEELGAGGMGRVFRAHDTKLNEEVALKLIKPEIAADKRTVERFHNEIKVARKIRHKNVCGMYDFHEEGKTLFLTMEYVRGEDLKSLIHRTKTLSVGTALSIGRQIAEGLGEAHKLGITHRDLKPGNVMIDKDGRAKIMDFGIARSLAGGGTTVEGTIIGTPEYMSPEQVEGKPADQRADIYSLGVILFEMVTGRVPFEGETPFSIANKHKSEPAPDPRMFDPKIPAELSRLILRCMEKPLEKRYQTTSELIPDIEAIEASIPTTERATGRMPSRIRPRTSREVTLKFRPRRLLIPTAAVLVLAVAGFFLWRNVIHKPAPPLPSAKPTLAIFNFENISEDPDLEMWKQGLRILLTTGLGQSRYLQILDEGTILGILKKQDLLQAEKYTADDLKRIALEGGATHILSGNYFPAGGKIIVTLSLIDAKTGTVIKPIQEEAADAEAIYNSVDSLVKKTKSALDIFEPAVEEGIYRMAGEVYSRNIKALQEYLLGDQYFQNQNSNEAIKSYERAVQIDPEFAMAYRKLSAMHEVRSDVVKSYQYIAKAYELRGKLPEKERLLIEASWLMQKEEDKPRAHEIFHKLVELYPDDFLVRFQLAHTGEFDYEERLKAYDYLLHVKNYKSTPLFGNLTSLYCYLEEYSKARACWEESLLAFPSEKWRRAVLGFLFILEGNLEAARGEFERAAREAADFNSRFSIADYYHAKEEPDKIGEILEKLRKTEKDPSITDEWSAVLLMMGGKFEEALAIGERTEARALSRGSGNVALRGMYLARGKAFIQTGDAGKALEKFQTAIEYLKKDEDQLPVSGLTGLIGPRRTLTMWQICALSDLGRTDEAEALYGQFERLIPQRWQRDTRLGLEESGAFAAGKIALAKKDAHSAVKKLEECLQKLPGEHYSTPRDHAYLLDHLADAYALAGSLDKSAKMYARIPGLYTGRLVWEAVYARSYYKLGKVLEQQGKKAEAREKYRKFLDLWKNADAVLTDVEDARRRLAALGP